MDAFVLTIVLTVVGLGLTLLAWRRRGVAQAMRAAGVTMLVPAAYLMGATPLLVGIGEDTVRWAVGLVFSPVVWTGVGLGVVGVLLFLAGGSMLSRGKGVTARRTSPAATGGGTTAKSERTPAAEGGDRRAVPPSSQKSSQKQDPGVEGMDDIEAILRKRGIT